MELEKKNIKGFHIVRIPHFMYEHGKVVKLRRSNNDPSWA